LGVEAILSTQTDRATPAMSDDTILPFGFPAVGSKKLVAAFDGGRITTDGVSSGPTHEILLTSLGLAAATCSLASTSKIDKSTT